MNEENKDIFRRAFETSNLKQKGFSDALGVSPGHVSEILNGNNTPSDSLTKLSRMLFLSETPEAIHKNIGSRLRKIRAVLGFTQAEMADKLGSAHNVRVSRLETGYTQPPPNILKLYAELGNTTVDALLSEDSEEYERAIDNKVGHRQNTGTQKPDEANEMDFNWKIGKIIDNAPEEEAQKILGQIDLAFRKYGEADKKAKPSKQVG